MKRVPSADDIDDRVVLMSKQQHNRSSIFQRLRKATFGGHDGLPPSNPHGWPFSTPEDLQERPKRVVKIGAPQIFSFADNNIRTSKYNVHTFLPKFLLEEFNPSTKLANCYFLVIAGLQCIPFVSNTGGVPTTLLPLIVVVLVDAIFQIFEDIKRHRADARANASRSFTFNYEQLAFDHCFWSQIEVGDIVKVHNRETIPADLILLSVAPKEDATKAGGVTNSGLCYVETKSLDGETNLKIRTAIPLTKNTIKNDAGLADLRGDVEMEHPNKLIESFNGVLSLPGLGREVIQPSHILLRGCVLRNTEYVYGLVVNTGHDTKIMMSSSATKMKASKLENAASSEISKIIGVLMFLCFWGATGQAIWNSVYHIDDIPYLKWPPEYSPVSFWFIDFFYFFLLHATFIPVSLYVSMSMARYLQSYRMNQDATMIDPATGQPATVRTMTLNEELGQISHVFSDKTGTLTCNHMDFRKMSINGVVYGQGITEIGKAAWKLQNKPIPPSVLAGEAKAQANAVPHVSFYCDRFTRDVVAVDNDSDQSDQSDKIGYFFRVLAICHDVIPEKVEGAVQPTWPATATTGEHIGDLISPALKYSASNPDDEALVCAAKYFGFEFVDRKDNVVTLLDRFHFQWQRSTTGASCERVEVLLTIPFSSKRKRMSVVIRDPATQTISLLCKGADTVMLPRLKSGQDTLIRETLQQVEDFAVEGLRCLFIAAATLREKDFLRWKDEYDRVSTDLREVEKKNKGDGKNKIEELEDVLEQSLFLLGATAIEDKLQAGVPDCIAQLVQAGTVLWVLTGDKEETAINIAVACNLLQPTTYMDHIIVNGSVAPDKIALRKLLEGEIQRHDRELRATGDDDVVCKPRALIIDGPSLLLITHDHHPTAATVAGAETVSPAGGQQSPQQSIDVGGGGPALSDLLLDLAMRCKAVVGCRVSPDQKKEMVRLVKENVPFARTLAIGDGANDVAMIQEAHVGVGIRGEEGTQAVNSADYAIGQFRFLGELLLNHGRYNYIRMSHLVCYMFYKNIVMSMGMFWFNFNCGFSGQKYYTEGAIQLFNLAYTSLPIIAYAFLDEDVRPATVHQFPQLYQATVNSEYFSPYVFWTWIGGAFIESIIVSVLPLFTLQNFHRGREDTFLFAGATCLSAVVIIVNLKMFFIQSQWPRWSVGLVALSVVVFYASLLLITSVVVFDFYFYGVFTTLLASSSYWLTLLLLVAIVVGKDVYLAGLERSFNFKPWHILQEMELAGRLPHQQASSSHGGAADGAAPSMTNAAAGGGAAAVTGGGVEPPPPGSRPSSRSNRLGLVNSSSVQPLSVTASSAAGSGGGGGGGSGGLSPVYAHATANAWENNRRTLPRPAL